MPESTMRLPAGAVVVIAGPDGSGKSSLAAALANSDPSQHVVWLHHRARVLPARGGVSDRPVTDPYGRTPYARAVSAAKVLYYFVDYLLGWALRIRPALRVGGAVVLERGWWDLAVDPRRYRLQGTAGLVAALARFTPQADRVFVLDAPTDVLLERTEDALTADDLAGQRQALHALYSGRAEAEFLDATQDRQTLVATVVARTVAAQQQGHRNSRERRWVALPRAAAARWFIPHGRRAAASGLRVYKPVTSRGLVGWRLANAAALAGVFRVLPSVNRLPVADIERTADWVPAGGTLAVGRSTHGGRYHAVTLDRHGRIHALVKVATDAAGQTALAREAQSLNDHAVTLRAPLHAPTLLHHEAGLLVTQGFTWQPSSPPWRLPVAVAHQLGVFYRDGQRDDCGPAHGDVTPWNLLRLRDGWALVDWEAAVTDAMPFFDVLHWLVASHALLGRPTTAELFDGLAGHGWIGDCIAAYADGAGLERPGMVAQLIRYLDATAGRCDLSTATGVREDTARRRLREAAVAVA